MLPADEFRIFYNHTIHPELMRLEGQRRRFLRLLLFSALLLSGIVFLQFYIRIPALSMLLAFPIFAYISYLIYQVQRFRSNFKPHVIRLILDFIDNSVNYGDLQYEEKKCIPKELFRGSRLFTGPMPEYVGEDYIWGLIGELPFEMCELSVKEFSDVRNRLNDVFRGVFLHASFKKELNGEIIILPRAFKPFLSRTIKAFTVTRGRNVDSFIRNDRFREVFTTYATPMANLTALLSEDMEESILDYREQTGKEIYISFIGSDIFVAVTQPKDLLEPMIFQSNLSFDLVREFYHDLQLLMSIVLDFDKNN